MLLMHRYGDFSLAASTDQPGMRLWGDADGAIAYREVRDGAHIRRVAVGEPLAPRDAWDDLARAFLSATPNAVFVNVGEVFGRMLTKERLYLNPLGWEAILDLRGGYDLAGPKKQNIRNAVSRATAAGCRVVEIDPADGDAWVELHRLSSAWVQRKGAGRPENALVTRPLMRRARHQRVFALCNSGDRIVHFMTFDEMWRDGHVVGYHANINRDSDDAPKSADYVVIATVIDILRTEGIPMLSLGLCPVGDATPPRQRNLYSSLFWQMAFGRGEPVYRLDGLTRHKAEFRPSTKRPVFVAGEESWPIGDIRAVLRTSNLA